MNNGFIRFAGREIPSQKIVSTSIAPINSSRRIGELEMEKDKLSLQADIKSVLYLKSRGIQIAH